MPWHGYVQSAQADFVVTAATLSPGFQSRDTTPAGRRPAPTRARPGARRDDAWHEGDVPMHTEPKLEDRPEQPYVAIRTQVTMQELGPVIPQLLGEVFAWLGQQGVSP